MQRTIVITAQNMPQSEQRSRMKPELNVKKKVEALERRRAMLHALIAFVQAHPRIASEAVLHGLAGNTGLFFNEYALIVPRWKNGKPVLRLVKSGDDWINSMDSDSYFEMERTVAEDISEISDEKLGDLLGSMYSEVSDTDDDP
jgi:hypothetical protein